MPIMKCACTDYIGDASKYQNAKYGEGNRVFNPCAKNNKGKFRCTVCGNMKGLPGADKKAPTPAAK